MKIDYVNLVRWVEDLVSEASNDYKPHDENACFEKRVERLRACFEEEAEVPEVFNLRPTAERTITARVQGPSTRTCGCKEGQMHTCGKIGDDVPMIRSCCLTAPSKPHGKGCCMGAPPITEKEPEAPKDPKAELCECGHQAKWHTVLDGVPRGCYGCSECKRFRARPTEEKPPEPAKDPLAELPLITLHAEGDRVSMSRDAWIVWHDRLRAAREEAKKAKAEVQRITDINDQFDRGPMETYRRAGEILDIDGAENLDHAARRVVDERDALKAMLEGFGVDAARWREFKAGLAAFKSQP